MTLKVLVYTLGLSSMILNVENCFGQEKNCRLRFTKKYAKVVGIPQKSSILFLDSVRLISSLEKNTEVQNFLLSTKNKKESIISNFMFQLFNNKLTLLERSLPYNVNDSIFLNYIKSDFIKYLFLSKETFKKSRLTVSFFVFGDTQSFEFTINEFINNKYRLVYTKVFKIES